MNKENVQMYFDHHPDVDTFYFTGDGQAFFTENEADNHARNLAHLNKDSSVARVERGNTDTVELGKPEIKEPAATEQLDNADVGIPTVLTKKTGGKKK